jgi:imidazoleglycerol phosphate dehydratase HisB
MSRTATVKRKTKETQIEVRLDIDGSGQGEISTGMPFMDHMLGHIRQHGLFDLTIEAKGDLDIDEHHTVEDVAITLAQAEVATTTYQACYETDQIRGYLGGHAGVTMTGATTRQLETISIGVPDVTMTFTTPFKFQNQAKVDYTVVSWTSFDRYRVVSWVQTCCGRPKIADVSVDLLVIAQRMQAAATRQAQ